jgi:hypothetical protein
MFKIIDSIFGKHNAGAACRRLFSLSSFYDTAPLAFFLMVFLVPTTFLPSSYLSGDPPSVEPLPGVHPELNVLPVPGASPNGLLIGVVGPEAGVTAVLCCPSVGIGGVSDL